MASSSTYKFEETPSAGNGVNKIVAKWFSGAAADIINQLLLKDISPYVRVGYYNLFFAIICGFGTYFIAFHFFANDIRVSLAYSIVTVLCTLLILIYNSGKLINKHPHRFQLVLTIILGIIITTISCFGFGLYSMKGMNQGFQITGWITTFSIFITCLSGFYIMYTTIQVNRNDFYHQLLDEKRMLESDYLNEQRKKISENYRLDTELKNISTGLSDLESTVDDAGKADIKNYREELSGTRTPSGLLAAAQITFRAADFHKSLEYLNKGIELENILASVDKAYKLTPEIYELKARTLRALELTIDAELAEKQARNIRDENSFLDNLSKSVSIEKLAINEISIFDNFTWYFKPGINILLGKNGYGKSHLLSLIIALMYDDKEKRKDWISGSKATATAALYLSGDVPGKELEEQLAAATKELREKQISMDNDVNNFVSRTTKKIPDEELEKIFDPQIQEIKNLGVKIIKQQADLSQYKPTISADANTIKSWTGRLPLLAIPDSRFINKSVDSIKASDSEFSDIAKYGAYEFLYSQPYAQVIENVLFKTCIGYFKGGSDFQQEPFGLIQRVIKDLSSDKLISKDGKLVYQDDSKFKFISIVENDKQASFTILVQPEDSNIELPIQKISQGTFSIFATCCLIYNYLKSLPQKETDVLKRAGIVIIDELDAHIHPSWQRKLIQIFRKNFPNVQFIISGHSPLLVEGCKANEVSVLRRTTAGKFKIETIDRSMVGLSIEDIYSFIFEVENRDFAMLRYKELSPYLESFKKELEELRAKGDNVSNIETERVLQLQDMITHIDISTKAFEKLENDNRNESKAISKFLTTAVETVIPSNIKS